MPDNRRQVFAEIKKLRDQHSHLIEFGCPVCESGDQFLTREGVGIAWESEQHIWGCTCGAEWIFEVTYKLSKVEVHNGTD